jgi:hypothetical protein
VKYIKTYESNWNKSSGGNKSLLEMTLKMDDQSLDTILLEFCEEFEMSYVYEIRRRENKVMKNGKETADIKHHVDISFTPLNKKGGEDFEGYFNRYCAKIVEEHNDKDYISKIFSEMESQLNGYDLTLFNGRFTLDISWSLITLEIYKK